MHVRDSIFHGHAPPIGVFGDGMGPGSCRAASEVARRRRTAVTIVALFLPLAFFKYVNFFYSGVFGPIFGWSGRLIDLSLPLGVSFVTLMSSRNLDPSFTTKYAG